MLTIDDIFRAVCEGKDCTGYNLLEMQGYNALRQVVRMYNRGDISKEEATKAREKIYKEYRDEEKQFNFMYEMFKKHTDDIKSTESDRTELRKLLNNNSEVVDIARVSLGILCKVFPRRV